MAERKASRNEELFADIISGELVKGEIMRKYGITWARVLQIIKEEALRQGIIDAEEFMDLWSIQKLRELYHERHLTNCGR